MLDRRHASPTGACSWSARARTSTRRGAATASTPAWVTRSTSRGRSRRSSRAGLLPGLLASYEPERRGVVGADGGKRCVQHASAGRQTCPLTRPPSSAPSAPSSTAWAWSSDTPTRARRSSSRRTPCRRRCRGRQRRGPDGPLHRRTLSQARGCRTPGSRTARRCTTAWALASRWSGRWRAALGRRPAERGAPGSAASRLRSSSRRLTIRGVTSTCWSGLTSTSPGEPATADALTWTWPRPRHRHCGRPSVTGTGSYRG